MSNPDRIAALIVKGYTRPLEEEERKELADWTRQAEENQLLFERLNDRSALKKHLQEYYSVMQEAGKMPVLRPARHYSPLKRAAVLAAVIAGLTLGAWLVLSGPGNKQAPLRDALTQSRITNNRQTDSLILPDGTRVWLNRSSFVYYPDSFRAGTREVIVSGEAYFEVNKDSQKPFIAKVVSQADTLLVTVLGTHFNVRAGKAGGTIITTVLQGHVRITNGAGGSVQLHAGEAVTADSNGLAMPGKADTSMAMAWKNSYFECTNKPIGQIMDQLKRWYGVEVIYQDTVPDHFSGVFEKANGLQHYLRIMEATTKVVFTEVGDTVIVRSHLLNNQDH